MKINPIKAEGHPRGPQVETWRYKFWNAKGSSAKLHHLSWKLFRIFLQQKNFSCKTLVLMIPSYYLCRVKTWKTSQSENIDSIYLGSFYERYIVCLHFFRQYENCRRPCDLLRWHHNHNNDNIIHFLQFFITMSS